MHPIHFEWYATGVRDCVVLQVCYVAKKFTKTISRSSSQTVDCRFRARGKSLAGNEGWLFRRLSIGYAGKTQCFKIFTLHFNQFTDNFN